MGKTRQGFIDQHRAAGWAAGMIEGHDTALREVLEFIEVLEKEHGNLLLVDVTEVRAKLKEMIGKEVGQ